MYGDVMWLSTDGQLVVCSNRNVNWSLLAVYTHTAQPLAAALSRHHGGVIFQARKIMFPLVPSQQWHPTYIPIYNLVTQVIYKLIKTRGVQTKMSPCTKANSLQNMAIHWATCVLVYVGHWMWCEQHSAFGSYSLLSWGMLTILRSKCLKMHIKKRNYIDHYWETREAAGTRE